MLFKYLGCWINQLLDPEGEIKARIEMAWSVFLKLVTSQLQNKPPFHREICWMLCVVHILYAKMLMWSVLSCEIWTVKQNSIVMMECSQTMESVILHVSQLAKQVHGSCQGCTQVLSIMLARCSKDGKLFWNLSTTYISKSGWLCQSVMQSLSLIHIQMCIRDRARLIMPTE